MLQSLTERVERLEAKAELFDKGLEVCVDAHKTTLKDTESWKASVQFLRKMIGAILIATGLRDKADMISRAFEQFEKEEEEVKRAISETAQEWAGSDAVEAYKAGVERGKQAESDLFSEPAEDIWIDSKDARELLGWRTISTSMLKGAGIRYQQPLGKHHKITAHKGDIENYIANRR